MAKLILSEEEKEKLAKYNFLYISIDSLKYRNIKIILHKNFLLLNKLNMVSKNNDESQRNLLN